MLLTRKETAAYLKISAITLEYWAKNDKGPPLIRMEGSIRYDKKDLENWLNSQKIGG